MILMSASPDPLVAAGGGGGGEGASEAEQACDGEEGAGAAAGELPLS